MSKLTFYVNVDDKNSIVYYKYVKIMTRYDLNIKFIIKILVIHQNSKHFTQIPKLNIFLLLKSQTKYVICYIEAYNLF